MRRRALLVATSASVAGTFAGCIGGGTDGSGDDELSAPIKGDSDADVLLQSWEDFRCPHCRTFHLETLPAIESEYVEPGRVKVQRHDFPIPIDGWSWSLGGAARCVQDRQGDDAFWTFADYVYERQSDVTEGTVRAGAEAAGADPDAVESAMESGDYRSVLEADRQRGAEKGVDATPAVFVNGDPVENRLPAIRSAIEDA